MPLYRDWRDKPATADLAALWTELGIRDTSGGLRYDDKAPSAAIRKAITAPYPTKSVSNLSAPTSAVAGRRFQSP